MAALSQAAAFALASLASDVGELRELGKGRPSHIWLPDDKGGTSLCGLPSRTYQEQFLLEKTQEFIDGCVCKNCMKALKKKIRS